MKKVLLMNSCKTLFGGIESFLLNIFYGLDQNEFDVTFLTCGKSNYGLFAEDILQKGGHIDEIPIFADSITNQIKLYKELRKYYRKNKPDIVHINSGGLSFHYLAAKAARAEGIKQIILHSHNFIPNQNNIKEKLKSVIKRQLEPLGDTFLACSNGAASWIFSDKLISEDRVEIIPNGIDTDKFSYSDSAREAFRASLGIDRDELLIGNIGRFSRQKNHPFMIKVMSKVVQSNPKAKLLLVGEGELRKEIEGLVSEFGLTENVLFLGERRDMSEFLSAIDVFILPSLFEGFGIVAVEAQASGVETILSDLVPDITNVTGKAVYLSIDTENSIDLWTKQILDVKVDTAERTLANTIVKKSDYDMSFCCQRMEKIYLGENDAR